jgi:hypothetical protein
MIARLMIARLMVGGVLLLLLARDPRAAEPEPLVPSITFSQPGLCISGPTVSVCPP